MIHIVAGALVDHDGRVLIAQRPPGKSLAGQWEFPGGKLEPGESRVEGLARELREELGITISHPRPLMRVCHSYDFGEVLIDMWVAGRYSGQPRGLDGQRLRWCTLGELDDSGLLPADRPIIRALRLPERLSCARTNVYVVKDSALFERPRARRRSNAETPLEGAFCDSVSGALRAAEQGAQFIVLRHPLSDEELCALGNTLSVPVFAPGIGLEHAWKQGVSGVSDIEF